MKKMKKYARSISLFLAVPLWLTVFFIILVYIINQYGFGSSEHGISLAYGFVWGFTFLINLLIYQDWFEEEVGANGMALGVLFALASPLIFTFKLCSEFKKFTFNTIKFFKTLDR